MNRRGFLRLLGVAPLAIAGMGTTATVIGIDGGGADGKIAMAFVADELHEFRPVRLHKLSSLRRVILEEPPRFVWAVNTGSERELAALL